MIRGLQKDVNLVQPNYIFWEPLWTNFLVSSVKRFRKDSQESMNVVGILSLYFPYMFHMACDGLCPTVNGLVYNWIINWFCRWSFLRFHYWNPQDPVPEDLRRKDQRYGADERSFGDHEPRGAPPWFPQCCSWQARLGQKVSTQKLENCHIDVRITWSIRNFDHWIFLSQAKFGFSRWESLFDKTAPLLVGKLEFTLRAALEDSSTSGSLESTAEFFKLLKRTPELASKIHSKELSRTLFRLLKNSYKNYAGMMGLWKALNPHMK